MRKKDEFKIGDYVAWNAGAGRFRGTIEEKVTSAIKFKTYTVRASWEKPQYLIKSDKTDHMAMQKSAALKKISKSTRPSEERLSPRRRNEARGRHRDTSYREQFRIVKTAGLKKKNARVAHSTVVLTIGHSTRTIEEFIGLLQAHVVSCLVDVRTIPRSRHNPQFNQDSLPGSLAKAGLSYLHLSGLGGLRHAKRDSISGGWRNVSFRGYADYMQTPEFKQSLEELIQLAKQEQIAIMCAEAMPWRCHRSLIADALLVRGIRAEDIMSLTRRQVHRLTSFAKVRGSTITYPAEALPSNAKELSAKRVRLRAKKAT